MAPRCGQAAKPTGNMLHQIQECGGSTALHGPECFPLERQWQFPCIRLEDVPSQRFPGVREVTTFCAMF